MLSSQDHRSKRWRRTAWGNIRSQVDNQRRIDPQCRNSQRGCNSNCLCCTSHRQVSLCCDRNRNGHYQMGHWYPAVRRCQSLAGNLTCSAGSCCRSNHKWNSMGRLPVCNLHCYPAGMEGCAMGESFSCADILASIFMQYAAAICGRCVAQSLLS